MAIVVFLSSIVAAIYLRYSYMGPHARYDIWKGEFQTMVTAIYFRYGYLSPHYRFDRWTGEMQVLERGGQWVQEKLAEKET